MKRTIRRLTAALLGLAALLSPLSLSASAAQGVTYFPDVTEAMTDPLFWAGENGDALLAARGEIDELNALALHTAGSNMHDLKALPETFNGLQRNESLRKGAQADADYYLGWTYTATGEKATQAHYDPIILNCIDRTATEEMPLRYGVAVNRALLVCFPSDEPIYDDPTDKDFNYQGLVGIRVNEPLAVFTTSDDGKYYQVYTSCCSGWVSVEDVALCASREEWLAAWDLPAEKRLVFYGDKAYTDYSYSSPETSHRMITMGTVLERAEAVAPGEVVANRLPVHNYVVYLPVREKDGSYRKQAALLNAQEKCSEDYLPLTAENIAAVALGALGDAYGWGGTIENEDCTSLDRNVYACFGLDLPRNGNWQWPLPVAKRDISGWSSEEKLALLDALPLGTLLQFPGHQMIYLGTHDGKRYVFSTVSSAMSPWEDGKRQRVRSALINTLDVKRANGNTWLQSLSAVLVPWQTVKEGDADPLPPAKWYQEAVSFCMKKGLMAAPGGYFRPEEAMTRAELAETLWRSAQSPAPEGTGERFADVPEGAAYEEALLWAREKGYVTGTSAATFSPSDTLTREQLAAVLWRYAGEPEADAAALAAFEDAGAVSGWAADAAAWAVQAGLLGGLDEKTLGPGGVVSRAQAAAVAMRYAALSAEK